MNFLFHLAPRPGQQLGFYSFTYSLARDWIGLYQKLRNINWSNKASPVLLELDSLIFKEKLVASDETVLDITENPLPEILHWFAFLSEKNTIWYFFEEVFWKRFSGGFINNLIEHILQTQKKVTSSNELPTDDDYTNPSSGKEPKQHPEKKTTRQGKLMMEAGCAPV